MNKNKQRKSQGVKDMCNHFLCYTAVVATTVITAVVSLLSQLRVM